MKKIMFVCLGNICRSPMAECVMRNLVEKHQLGQEFAISSSGTANYHVGEDMHQGTAQILAQHGISKYNFVCSQFDSQDIDGYTYIVAMDNSNVANIVKKLGYRPKNLHKLTDFIPGTHYSEVPDPWYTSDFNETYDLVTKGCQGILTKLGYKL